MNNRIIALLSLAFIVITSLSAIEVQQKPTPAGSWKFEAPYAPEGYTTGKIDVVPADNNYVASISFAGNDYKIKGEKVKYENDILTFSAYIEGTEITVNLKLESPVKMTGKAVYYEGEIPLTLSREQQTR